MAFGLEPNQAIDILIDPYKGTHSGMVAADRGGAGRRCCRGRKPWVPAGPLVGRLTFEQVLRVVVPKTSWWIKKWEDVDAEEPHRRKAGPRVGGGRHLVNDYDVERTGRVVRELLTLARNWRAKTFVPPKMISRRSIGSLPFPG